MVTSQAAVAGIALAVISLAPMLGAMLPDPTVILDWAVKVGVGESAGVLPVVTWAATLGGLVAFSLRRMERMEL